MKNQKGITLIALVITIIVLLILAGITIAMLTGDNGLLTKTQSSASQTAIAGAKDEVNLIYQETLADFLENKYTNSTAAASQNLASMFATKVNALTDSKKHGCTVTANATSGLVTVTYNSNGQTTTVYGKLTTTANNEKLEWDSNS